MIGRITKIKSYFLLIFIFFIVSVVGGESLRSESKGKKGSGNGLLSCSIDSNSESCEAKIKRYFLYDVNPGEGFNLRRDVYIRIAPLIYSLNQLDTKSQWILVLPPWGRIPHWTSSDYYPWSTYFQIEAINNYIPAIELSEYLENFGYETKLDYVFQLQHFPFDPEDKTWSEKVEVGSSCEETFNYKWREDTKDFSGRFWDEKIKAVNATCMSLRGQGSTLVKFLMGLNYTSVMFDRAEVILWDSYGNYDWWRARRSLRFNNALNAIADSYLQKSLNQSESSKYNLVGVHLRRRDFVFGRRKLSLPTLPGAAKQAFQIAKRLKLDAVFLATDATFEEFEDFLLGFKILKEDHSSTISLMSLHPFLSQNFDKDSLLDEMGEGELAILDQIICSKSNYFIGTPDSTFTLRIFEEREILLKDSDSTFNYLCPDLPNDEDVFTEDPECNQPTKWRMVV